MVGGAHFAGSNYALQYVNIRGSRGAQTANGVQRAQNYEAYRENRFWVLPDVALVPAPRLLRDERDYENRLTRASASPRPTTGFNPKVGLLWQPRPEVQVFGNITRSQDVPDFSDLVADGATGPPSCRSRRSGPGPTRLGTRGRFDRGGWDVTLYRSQPAGRADQFSVNPGLNIPAGTFNAGTHRAPGRRVRPALSTCGAGLPAPATG